MRMVPSNRETNRTWWEGCEWNEVRFFQWNPWIQIELAHQCGNNVKFMGFEWISHDWSSSKYRLPKYEFHWHITNIYEYMTHHDASCISCIQHSSFSTILAMMTWSPPYVWSGTGTPGWLEVEPGFGRGWGHDIHEMCSERCRDAVWDPESNLDDVWRWLKVLYIVIYRPFKIL